MLTASDTTLERDLDALLEPVTLGDPERAALRWTSNSAAKLAGQLGELGHRIVDRSVLGLLGRMGFSMQANRKTREGSDHPNRDAQFGYINETVMAALEAKQPVINDQRRHQKEGARRRFQGGRAPMGPARASPCRSTRTIFPAMRLARRRRTGSMTSPATRGTCRSASAAIPRSSRPPRSWPGGSTSASSATPQATTLTITADCGRSNSARGRLWKLEVQRLADLLGLQIRVLHYPPGTSKWNRIEHRMFSYISQNWRAKPLSSYQAIINLIAATQDDERPEDLRAPRRQRVRQGHQGQQGPDGRHQSCPPRVPRRLELHDHAITDRRHTSTN